MDFEEWQKLILNAASFGNENQAVSVEPDISDEKNPNSLVGHDHDGTSSWSRSMPGEPG